MMHHLDPRQAGVTEPDVEVVRLRRVGRDWSANWMQGELQCNRLGPTEAAALRAAREAAGFGHVAEQPCGKFQYWGNPDNARMFAGECANCAWPEDRHGKGER